MGSDKQAHAEYVNEASEAAEREFLSTNLARLRSLAGGTFRESSFECCLLYGEGAMTPPAPLPGEVTVEDLASALCKEGCTVTKVDIAHVGGGAAMGEAMARALRENKRIRCLRLRHTQDIGADACMAILRAAAGCPKLQVLELCECGVSLGGASELCNLVAASTELKEVGMGWNRELGSEGFAAICEGMASNASVTSLKLQGLKPGPRGAASLACMLARNSTLQYVDLEHCGLGADEGRVLLAGLRLNGSVKGIRLHGNDLGNLKKEIDSVAEKAADRDFLWYHCIDKDIAKTLPERLEEGLLQAACAGELGLGRVREILGRLAAHPQLQGEKVAAAAGRVLKKAKKGASPPGMEAVVACLSEAAAMK